MSRIRTRLAAFALAVAVPASLAGCFGGDDPQQTLDDTTLQGISSGVLDASAEVGAGSAGNVTARLEGPFDGQLVGQTGELPQVDWTGSIEGSGLGQTANGTAQLVITSDNLYATFQGTTYQFGTEAFKQLQGLQEQAQAQTQTEGSTTPSFTEGCQQAIEQSGGDTSACDIDFSSWLTNLSDEGTADVGGTSTTHIHADVDVEAMLNDLAGLAQQAGGGAIDTSQASQLGDAVTGATIDVYSGEDDHILREAAIALTFDPSKVPALSATPVPVGPVSFKLSIAFSDVNQAQTISAPPGAENAKQIKGITDLFQGGLGSLGGLGGTSSQGGSETFPSG